MTDFVQIWHVDRLLITVLSLFRGLYHQRPNKGRRCNLLTDFVIDRYLHMHMGICTAQRIIDGKIYFLRAPHSLALLAGGYYQISLQAAAAFVWPFLIKAMKQTENSCR